MMGEETVDTALLERWALAYLGRFASSAENLRRVLLRRVRRRSPASAAVREAAKQIDALVERIAAPACSTMRPMPRSGRNRSIGAASRWPGSAPGWSPRVSKVRLRE